MKFDPESGAKPAVYKVSEIAFLLSTTEWNVYEMIRRDEIPGVIMLGKKYRILRSVFNAAYAIDSTPSAEKP